MYPARSQARSDEYLNEIARWNAAEAPVVARESGPRRVLSRLREFSKSNLQLILVGVSATLLLLLNLTLFVTGQATLGQSLREGFPWLQSPLFWIALLVIQLSFLLAFLAEDRRKRSVMISHRENEQDLALAAASANIGLWNWDLGNDKIRASEFCRQILGMRPDAQCSLRQFFEVVHADDRDRLRLVIDDALATGHKFEIELRVILRERGIRWISASGQPRYNDGPRPIGLAGVFADITDRKQAEAEAAQQREYVTHLTRVRMIGALSGAVAHELNQPLTAILSNAQAAQRMLSRQSIDVEELKTTIKDIIDDDGRAAQVIKHLRSLLTKSDANFETVELIELVTETLELVRAELIERQIRLVVRLDTVLPAVKADRVQLQQVVLNLILNAADALMAVPAGNRILTLTASSADGSVTLLCSDSGPGIPAKALDQVFEPFFTTKKHGLGLGLLISRAIVTAHGGSLWATNNPGKGATFHLKLPALTPAMS